MRTRTIAFVIVFLPAVALANPDLLLGLKEGRINDASLMLLEGEVSMNAELATTLFDNHFQESCALTENIYKRMRGSRKVFDVLLGEYFKRAMRVTDIDLKDRMLEFALRAFAEDTTQLLPHLISIRALFGRPELVRFNQAWIELEEGWFNKLIDGIYVAFQQGPNSAPANSRELFDSLGQHLPLHSLILENRSLLEAICDQRHREMLQELFDLIDDLERVPGQCDTLKARRLAFAARYIWTLHYQGPPRNAEFEAQKIEWENLLFLMMANFVDFTPNEKARFFESILSVIQKGTPQEQVRRINQLEILNRALYDELIAYMCELYPYLANVISHSASPRRRLIQDELVRLQVVDPSERQRTPRRELPPEGQERTAEDIIRQELVRDSGHCRCSLL